MAWCRQARFTQSMSLHGVTKPQLVTLLRPSDAIWSHEVSSTLVQWFVAWQYQAICRTSADLSSVKTMYIQNTNGPFNETGTVCLDLYNVTNCTGNILWRFTKTTSSGNMLHYSHYKQCTYAITKKQKKWCKIIPYKERDNIAAVTPIWRGVFSWLIENS